VDRLASSLRQQLRLTRRSMVMNHHAASSTVLARPSATVILENDALFLPERLCDTITLAGLEQPLQ